MRVLFISSGNSKTYDIVPFIRKQGESLKQKNIEISYFTVQKAGVMGYLREAIKLRKFLKKSSFDLIHAHYTLSGWVAVLSCPKTPVILSLMGSDAYGDFIDENKVRLLSRYLTILTWLIQPFVSYIICKSIYIESFVINKKKSTIIPNGIVMDEMLRYNTSDKEELGLDPEKKHILFLGIRDFKRKNYALAEEAVNLLDKDKVVLLAPYPVEQMKVYRLLHVADVLLLTSFMEGSPNVVKEAMACNCPVVATNVGDIDWLFGYEPGHFLTGFNPEDVAEKIKMALEFGTKQGRTKGRERIIELGLDSETVAGRIVEVYEKVLRK